MRILAAVVARLGLALVEVLVLGRDRTRRLTSIVTGRSLELTEEGCIITRYLTKIARI